MTTALMHIPVADPTGTLGTTNGVAFPSTGNLHGSAAPADQAAHHHEAQQHTLLDGCFRRGLLKPRARGGYRASTQGADDVSALGCFPKPGSNMTEDMRGTHCHSSGSRTTGRWISWYPTGMPGWSRNQVPLTGPLPYLWDMAGENLRRGTSRTPRRHHHGKY